MLRGTGPYAGSVEEMTPVRLGDNVAILGAGPIGCEMSQAFARFGSKVYLLERFHKILEKEDADAAGISWIEGEQVHPRPIPVAIAGGLARRDAACVHSYGGHGRDQPIFIGCGQGLDVVMNQRPQ